MDTSSIAAMSANMGLSAQQMSMAQMQTDSGDASGFESALNAAMQSADSKALMDGCKSFESYFVQMMFREMRKTAGGNDGILPDSQATQTFQDMLDQQYAENISNGQGIGIADMMYKQLSAQMAASAV